MTKGAQAPVAVHDLDLLSDNDISVHWKKRKDGRKCRLTVNYEEWDMIDLQAIGEVVNARTTLIRVSNDDDFVSTVYEFGGELVNMRLDTAGLRVEEVADHGDVIRHFGELTLWHSWV